MTILHRCSVMIILAALLAPGTARGVTGEATPLDELGTSATGPRVVDIPRQLRSLGPVELVAVPDPSGDDGGRLMAVGSRVVSPDGPDPADAVGLRGEVWASPDGERWERSHRLPLHSELAHAFPGSDGSVLVIGTISRRGREGIWRLFPDGSVARPEPIGMPRRHSVHEASVASHRDLGTVIALDSHYGIAKGLEVLRHEPGEDWELVALPGSGFAVPIDVVATSTGFVVIGDDFEGLVAWRSQDGVTWSGPQPLPDSFDDRFDGGYDHHLATDAVYDERLDVLLVLGYPDRVWLSTAGSPFERAGPLAVALPVPSESSGWPAHHGVALADGFLVASGSWSAGSRLQTSSDGRTWTAVPPSPGGPSWSVDLLVRHGDRVVALGAELEREGRAILMGGARVADYTP